MRILFCADPLNTRKVDSSYQTESDACVRAGLPQSVIDLEALSVERDAAKAVQKVEEASVEETGIYRGWMVTPSQYEDLYTALMGRGIKLVNSPGQYEHAHYLPGWYGRLEGKTPKSMWTLPGDSFEIGSLVDKLAVFDGRPLILKDYVKSRKHEWNEACYIESGADTDEVGRVVRRFLELQGDQLNVGLVFREFVPFRENGARSRGGIPLIEEYRLFVLNGNIFAASSNGDGVVPLPENLPLRDFEAMSARIESSFFTMDVAQTSAGDWLVVELGDGQVAGLPDSIDPRTFYAELRDKFDRRNP